MGDGGGNSFGFGSFHYSPCGMEEGDSVEYCCGISCYSNQLCFLESPATYVAPFDEICDRPPLFSVQLIDELFAQNGIGKCAERIDIGAHPLDGLREKGGQGFVPCTNQKHQFGLRIKILKRLQEPFQKNNIAQRVKPGKEDSSGIFVTHF